MTDRRRHRGPGPSDAHLFSSVAVERISAAVQDASWLLSRGYSANAVLTLVGNRYALHRRQRVAVRRMADADSRCEARLVNYISNRASEVAVDTFNVLITVECALGGALVIEGRDGCYRDLAGLRGTYRVVEETHRAIELIGQTLDELKTRRALWLLDRPVSNSGRLANLLRMFAEQTGRNWTVRLEENVDRALLDQGLPVATTDSGILDRCTSWFDLGRETIDRYVPHAWILRPSR